MTLKEQYEDARDLVHNTKVHIHRLRVGASELLAAHNIVSFAELPSDEKDRIEKRIWRQAIFKTAGLNVIGDPSDVWLIKHTLAQSHYWYHLGWDNALEEFGDGLAPAQYSEADLDEQRRRFSRRWSRDEWVEGSMDNPLTAHSGENREGGFLPLDDLPAWVTANPQRRLALSDKHPVAIPGSFLNIATRHQAIRRQDPPHSLTHASAGAGHGIAFELAQGWEEGFIEDDLAATKGPGWNALWTGVPLPQWLPIWNQSRTTVTPESVIDYVLDHTPYSTLASAKSAETKDNQYLAFKNMLQVVGQGSRAFDYRGTGHGRLTDPWGRDYRGNPWLLSDYLQTPTGRIGPGDPDFLPTWARAWLAHGMSPEETYHWLEVAVWSPEHAVALRMVEAEPLHLEDLEGPFGRDLGFSFSIGVIGINEVLRQSFDVSASCGDGLL